jgi:hypothetical protein
MQHELAKVYWFKVFFCYCNDRILSIGRLQWRTPELKFAKLLTYVQYSTMLQF